MREQRRFTLIYADVFQIARTPELASGLHALWRELEIITAQQSTDKVFVHAGAIGWKDRGVIFPRHSMSGKSTLVKALLQAGGQYISDEYALIDSMGKVHHYSRKLTLWERDGRASQVSALNLGASACAEGLLLDKVVFTAYRDRARWKPRRLSLGQGVLRLMSHVATAPSKYSWELSILLDATMDKRIFEGARPDADSSLSPILQFIDSI